MQEHQRRAPLDFADRQPDNPLRIQRGPAGHRAAGAGGVGVVRLAGTHSQGGDVLQLFRQFERHRAAAAGRQHRRLDAPVDQLYEYGGQPAQRGRPAQQIRRAPQHRADPHALSRSREHRLYFGQHLRRHLAAGARAQGDGELSRPESGAGGQPRRRRGFACGLCVASAPVGRDARHVARRQRRRIPHAAFAQRSGAAQSPSPGLLDHPDGHRRRGRGRFRPQLRERRQRHRGPDQGVL